MRKLFLLIILSFIFYTSFGQPISQRSGSSITALDQNLFAGLSFRLPVFNDTSSANLAHTLDSCGKQIFTYDVMAVWVRQCSPKRWQRVGVDTASLSARINLKQDTTYRINDSTIGFTIGGRVHNIQILGGNHGGGGGGGSGITSLNTLTGAIQTFANGTSGLSPNIVSAGTVHTFNNPLAVTAGVLNGGISNSAYLFFTNKLNLSDTAAMLSTYVRSSRNVNTGFGLSGGGNLSSDRTFLADTSISGLSSYYLRRKDSATGFNLNGYLTRSSVNSFVPAQFNPIAGANMTITGTYPNITFASTGGGGGGITSIGTINSQTSAANGGVISGSTFYFQYPDTVLGTPGLMKSEWLKRLYDSVILLFPTKAGYTAMGGTRAPNNIIIKGVQISQNGVTVVPTAGGDSLLHWDLAGTEIPISSLVAADKQNAIDNAGYSQTWNWDNYPLSVAYGLGLSRLTTLAGDNESVFFVQAGGANATSGVKTFGSLIQNFHSGTGSINVAGSFRSSGAASNYSLELIDGTQGTGKVLTSDANGLASWATLPSGSTFYNSNIGSGFRLAIPNTNNIKTLFGSNTILLDSSSNTNGITIKADTSILATQYDITRALIDSATSIVGNIYTGTTWSSLTGFTANGLTAGTSAGRLTISGSLSSNDQSLDLSGYGYTGLEYWRVYARYNAGQAAGTTTNGVGVGVRTYNASAPSSLIAAIDLSNGSNAGKVIIINTYPTGSFLAMSTATISYSSGDSLEVTCEQAGNYIVATGRNVTTNSTPVIVTYVYSTAHQPVLNNMLPNIGKFAVFTLGTGNFSIDSLNVFSKEVVRPDLLMGGDSKFKGYDADWNYRIASQLKGNFQKLVVSAGGGDKTVDFLNKLPQVISLHPRAALLDLGTNNGEADSNTVKTEYASIVTQLQAAGITVYHTVLYQSNMLWRWNWINRTYPAANIINTWDALQQNGALGVDNVHPTNYGDSLAYNAILNFSPFKGAITSLPLPGLDGTIGDQQVAFGLINKISGNNNLKWDGTHLMLGIPPSPTGQIHLYQNSVDGGLNLVLENAGAVSGAGKTLTLSQIGSNGYGITGFANAGVIEAGANGGLYLGAYGGPINMATGSGSRNIWVRLNASGVFNIGAQTFVGDLTTVPDSAFEVLYGVRIRRGLNLSGIQRSANATDSMMVINVSNGNVGYRAIHSGGGGAGTVTSVATGYGLSGGTITATGTLIADSATLSLYYLRRKDSATASFLNGYLTRTNISSYYPTWQQTLTAGSVFTTDNQINQNGNNFNMYGDVGTKRTWFTLGKDSTLIFALYNTSGTTITSATITGTDSSFSIVSGSSKIKIATLLNSSSSKDVVLVQDSTTGFLSHRSISSFSGANTALSNLASVAINTALLPGATGKDLGAASTAFRDLYLHGSGTYGTGSLKITGTPTAARTVTLPDASITVARSDAAQTFTGVQTFSSQITASAGVNIPLGSGTNRDAKINAVDVGVNNYCGLSVYPTSGTNVSSLLAVIPKGTGFASNNIFNMIGYMTDDIADPTNYEFAGIRGTSTVVIVGTGKGGTGTNRPLMLAASYLSDGSTNSNQILLNTDGKVGINNGSPSEILDVTGNIRFSGALMPNNSAGLTGQVLTSASTSTPPTWNYPAGFVVASGDNSSQSATLTVATYTTPNDGSPRVYNVSASVNVTAVSAGVLTTTCTYTDEENVSRTVTFFGMGTTSAGLTTTGVSNFAVMGDIIVKPNTAISVATTLTIGTATFDVHATVRYVRTVPT